MASLIQSPFVRLSYPAIDNPVYSQDTVAANQGILDMVSALAGLGASDFAIFSGLVYTPGTPNTFTAGFYYLNGTWYYQPSTFNEGLYLTANITGIMPYTFEDAVSRPTYDENLSQSTTSPSGSTPMFSGNMNAYRLDNKTLLAEIKVLQTATLLEVDIVATLPSTYTVPFTNDKSIFFTSATVNTVISFSFTNAIPGTVVTLKWTFAGSETLSIPAAAGQTILMESGDQTNVGSNINILTILYAGVNSAGNNEVRLVLSQPVIPT